jgi:glycine oxidase
MLAPVSEADFGEERKLALNLAAASRYPSFVAELEAASGVATGYARTGALAVARDRDDVEALRRLHEHHLELGLDATWLTGRECRRLEPGLAPGTAGGVLAPGDHQVAPKQVVAALAAAFAQAGGELRSHTGVSRLIVDGDVVDGVLLDSGEHLRAPWVVVAAGAHSGRLPGLPAAAALPVRPVKGQVLRLRARPGEAPGRVVRSLDVYVVPRPDGDVIVGATMEERGFDTSVTAGAVLDLLRDAYEVLPGVAELELLDAVAGLRPGTPDNGPVVGEGAIAGLVWATGHWRNGVLLAPVTADAVVQLLEGGGLPDLFAPFTPARFAGQTAPVGAGRP